MDASSRARSERFHRAPFFRSDDMSLVSLKIARLSVGVIIYHLLPSDTAAVVHIRAAVLPETLHSRRPPAPIILAQPLQSTNQSSVEIGLDVAVRFPKISPTVLTQLYAEDLTGGKASMYIG